MSISKVGLDDEGFKSAFLEGKLAIDCPEINLTQKGVDKPRVYSSTGYILVNPENGVESRLILKRDLGIPYNPIGHLKEMLSIQSGELYPESHFYRLEATDVSGNVWTNPAVMLKIEPRTTAEILTFTCDYIEVSLQGGGSSKLAHFVFSNNLKFPLNRMTESKEMVRGQERLTLRRSLSTGTVSGMQVYYHNCSGVKGGEAFELIALAAAGQDVPEDFDERLLEAVRFCSATWVSPVMSEVMGASGRMLRLTKAKPLNNGFVEPPLTDVGASQDFYRLMSCYYDYACQNAQERDMAPLSSKLGGLFTLKGVWVETIALLVCVATESILDDSLFKSLGKPNPSLLEKIKELFEYIKKAPVEQNLLDRALSAVGSIKSNRAVDKMHALAKAAAIAEDDIASWKFLRNPVAHGSFEVDEEKFQELLDHIYRLTTLIYKLVFLKIGYVGKYTDYAERGWVTREYDALSLLKALSG